MIQRAVRSRSFVFLAFNVDTRKEIAQTGMCVNIARIVIIILMPPWNVKKSGGGIRPAMENLLQVHSIKLTRHREQRFINIVIYAAQRYRFGFKFYSSA